MDSRWVVLCMLALSFPIHSCLGASGRQADWVGLAVEAIGGGVAGPQWGLRPGARWIGDDEAMASTLQTMGRSVLPAGPHASLPRINFVHDAVLLVWMGEQPTGGYGLELIPGTSHVRDRVAYVTVAWNEPPADALVPQVITQPYLMLRMSRAGYARIVVVDQNGRVRATLDLDLPPPIG